MVVGGSVQLLAGYVAAATVVSTLAIALLGQDEMQDAPMQKAVAVLMFPAEVKGSLEVMTPPVVTPSSRWEQITSGTVPKTGMHPSVAPFSITTSGWRSESKTRR